MGCKTVDKVVKHLVRIFGHFASVKSLARTYVTHASRCGHKCKFVLFSDRAAGGTGDMLYLLSLLENSSDKHDYCIFLKPNTPADSIAQLFPSLRKSYYTNRHERAILDSVADIRARDFWPHQPHEHFLHELILAFPAGLSTNRQLKIELGSDKKVFKLFHSLSCKRRKTVLICPHSTNTPVSASDEYWIRYAEELGRKGYVPIFNSSKKFGSFESIFLGRRETILFAALAGNVVGVRSGLLDILIYFTNARAIVFYPSEPILGQEKFISNFWDNPTKRLLDYYSLNKIYPDKNIQECVFNNEYVFGD